MRLAVPVALALLAVALAGCSGNGSEDPPATGTGSSASSSTTGPPPKPVVLSDTLHLLAPPDMALVLPPGSTESSTGTAMDFGPGGGGENQAPIARWTFQVTANSTVTAAEIHVWVEIRDTLLQPVDPRTPQDTCTWYASLALGSDGAEEQACLSEPPGPINAGTKELIFELLGLDGDLEVNETITFSFNRRAFSASPEDSVYVLSGSEAHDSRLVLRGLNEPVPDA